jgi:hypothetical protein
MNESPAVVTQFELNAWVAKWQSKLRLEDWDIEVGLQRQFDMPDPADQGYVRCLRSQKKARISLLDPVDFEPDSLSGPQDLEQTIVHELVHVHHAGIEPTEGEAMIISEQATDAIAWALVNCDRGC